MNNVKWSEHGDEPLAPVPGELVTLMPDAGNKRPTACDETEPFVLIDGNAGRSESLGQADDSLEVVNGTRWVVMLHARSSAYRSRSAGCRGRPTLRANACGNSAASSCSAIEIGTQLSALVRQQHLNEKVVAIRVLLGLRMARYHQMTFVSGLVGFLFELYAMDRVVDAMASVS